MYLMTVQHECTCVHACGDARQLISDLNGSQIQYFVYLFLYEHIHVFAFAPVLLDDLVLSRLAKMILKLNNNMYRERRSYTSGHSHETDETGHCKILFIIWQFQMGFYRLKSCI